MRWSITASAAWSRPVFGDIFAGNAVNNGLVAAVVAEADIEKLAAGREQTGAAGRSISRSRPSSRQP